MHCIKADWCLSTVSNPAAWHEGTSSSITQHVYVVFLTWLPCEADLLCAALMDSTRVLTHCDRGYDNVLLLMCYLYREHVVKQEVQASPTHLLFSLGGKIRVPGPGCLCTPGFVDLHNKGTFVRIQTQLCMIEHLPQPSLLQAESAYALAKLCANMKHKQPTASRKAEAEAIDISCCTFTACALMLTCALCSVRDAMSVNHLIYSLAMAHDNQMLPLDCRFPGRFPGRFLRILRVLYLGSSFLSCLYLNA